MKQLIRNILREGNFDWVDDVPSFDKLPQHGQAWMMDVSNLSEQGKENIYKRVIVPSGWMFSTHRDFGDLSAPWDRVVGFGAIFRDDINDGNVSFSTSGRSIEIWNRHNGDNNSTILLYRAISPSEIEFIEEIS